MSVENVKKLVSLSKEKEALELLKGICVGPYAIYEDKVIQLSARLASYEEAQMEGLDSEQTIIRIRKDILRLVLLLETQGVESDAIQRLLDSCLLIENSFPFIGRGKFRSTVKKCLVSDQADIFLVAGESRSGMSHLEKFLNHLSKNLNIFTLYSFDIPVILDDPSMALGEKLAKYISYKLNISADFDQEEGAQFKFIQFINRLKDKIKADEKVPLFFLHDFHKIQDDNENLLALIHMMITEINNEFPKSLFIVAGLNYEGLREWHDNLRYTTKIYKMESTSIEEVESCLETIFGHYQLIIQEILEESVSLEEYKEMMKEKLLEEDQKVNIENVGRELTDHLFTLKNH